MQTFRNFPHRELKYQIYRNRARGQGPLMQVSQGHKLQPKGGLMENEDKCPFPPPGAFSTCLLRESEFGHRLRERALIRSALNAPSTSRVVTLGRRSVAVGHPSTAVSSSDAFYRTCPFLPDHFRCRQLLLCPRPFPPSLPFHLSLPIGSSGLCAAQDLRPTNGNNSSRAVHFTTAICFVRLSVFPSVRSSSLSLST